MPVVTEYLEDFSGGEKDNISSLEFGENEWMELYGFVYDNERRLRAQWRGGEWDVSLEESS